MSFLRIITQRDLAREIFTLPRRSLFSKTSLFTRALIEKGIKHTLGKRGYLIKKKIRAEEVILCNRRLKRAELWRQPGRMLVIGSSLEQMFTTARERGYEPYGIELNRRIADRDLNKSDPGVRGISLKDSEMSEERYDLIIFINCLEHLFDPADQMRMAAHLLEPSGIVMVIVPGRDQGEAHENALAGGSYDAEKHISLFDSNSLKELGKQCGLELIDVDTELSAGVGYVGALMAFFRRADFDIPPTASLISVRADGARGDTLLATPVLRGIRRRFPDARIQVVTAYPSLLEGLDGIETVPAKTPAQGDVQVRALYAINPGKHVVDVMTRYCRAGKPDRHIYYRVREDEKKLARKILREAGVKHPAAGIHPITGSRIKRWNKGKWRELVERLTTQGLCPVLVGSRDDTTPVPSAADLRGRLSPRDTLAVLGELDIFIGLDSFPAHAAGAVRTPRVILFGSTDPNRILCDTDCCPTTVLQGDCPYLGCRQDCLPEKWFRNIECRRGEPVCLESISPRRVCTAAIDLLKKEQC